MNKLDFIIIGAQKSGSSFLDLCLNSHPDIYIPRREIPVFESPDYENGDIALLTYMLSKSPGKVTGIRRPSYIGKPEVPGRILSNFPTAKLIAVLRNPVDRAISAYFHNIRHGFLPPVSIEEGIPKIICSEEFRKFWPRAQQVIEFGYYYKYLSLYKEYFDKNQFLLFTHDDLLSYPERCVRSAYEFLGVDPSIKLSVPRSRPQQVVYNINRLKFLSSLNKFVFQYNDDKTRLFVKEKYSIGKAVTNLGLVFDAVFLRHIFRKDERKVSAELKEILYSLYREDIDHLSELIDRDLSGWRAATDLR